MKKEDRSETLFDMISSMSGLTINKWNYTKFFKNVVISVVIELGDHFICKLKQIFNEEMIGFLYCFPAHYDLKIFLGLLVTDHRDQLGFQF